MSTSIRYLRLYLHCPMHGKRAIGYLSEYGDTHRVSFDESYINDPARPTLSLSYRGRNEAETRAILTAMRDVRVARSDGRLPVYFQNLLPEGHNRERLARQRNCDVENEFELLAAAGHDLMGGLEVEPVPADESIPHAVRHWHTALGLDVLEPGFVEFPVEDAASLPGVVIKFSAVLEGRRYVVKRRGAAGSIILKLPSARHPDLVQNEYAGYQLMRVLGLTCAEASIISREDAELPEQVPFDTILAVKRFDRGENGARVHMEEFAQALQYAPKNKYGKDLHSDYAAVLSILDGISAEPAQDVKEFVKRLVGFILMGNVDAHLKNWSLIYPNGVDPVLAPVYDPVCVTAFFEGVPVSDYALNRKIDNTVRAFTWHDLEAMLRKAGILRATRLVQVGRETARQAIADWPELLKDAPDNMRRSVTERLQGGLALTRDLGPARAASSRAT